MPDGVIRGATHHRLGHSASLCAAVLHLLLHPLRPHAAEEVWQAVLCEVCRRVNPVLRPLQREREGDADAPVGLAGPRPELLNPPDWQGGCVCVRVRGRACGRVRYVRGGDRSREWRCAISDNLKTFVPSRPLSDAAAGWLCAHDASASQRRMEASTAKTSPSIAIWRRRVTDSSSWKRRSVAAVSCAW